MRRPLDTVIAATRRVAGGNPEVELPRGAAREIGPGLLAVRSSLVCEDSASVSCAGLLDTVLNVDGGFHLREL